MKTILYLPEMDPFFMELLYPALQACDTEIIPCSSCEMALKNIENYYNSSVIVLILNEKGLSILEKLTNWYPKCHAMIFLNSPKDKIPMESSAGMYVRNFVVFEGYKFNPQDILTIVRKWKSRDIFGISKHLREKTAIEQFRIHNRQEKHEALLAIRDYVLDLGEGLSSTSYQQKSDIVSIMVDELIMNGIFDANPRFAEAVRNSDFQLNHKESVLVQWAFDGMIFAFSVSDSFGMLRRDIILKYLGKTLTGEAHNNVMSAGIGLKFVYSQIVDFIVNVNPQTQTELIGLMDFTKKGKSKRARSFHYNATEVFF